MSTTPEQRTLTRGGHWMRVIDAANWIYHFGKVSIVADRLDLMAGNLESGVHSRLNRDGWDETVHASEVWPISWSLYHYAGAAGWDVRNMNRSSEAYAELVVVYSHILQRRMDVKNHERRDLKWFVKEVETSARMTAPSGYRGFNRISDRRLLLRFTSAKHAQGAWAGLRQRGFRVTPVHPSALDVLDRSEA